MAHVGIMLNCGSRDETPETMGLAHFWEHMAFKGTATRSATQIINRIEALGGELNAYTSKDKICFYITIQQGYFTRALELLTDITFHSIFPEKEIEKEKEVILEEMQMYRDAPDDAIQDEFDELLYKGHSLGYNILGTEQTVGSFKKSDFEGFVQQHMDTHQMTVSVVSGLPHSRVLGAISQILGRIGEKKATFQRNAFVAFHPEIKEVKKPIGQAHCLLGGPAPTQNDEERYAFFLLNNLLGGPAMNSRLNMALREKRGMVYTVESQQSAYEDCGSFSIYLATDAKKLDKALKLIKEEADKLIHSPLSPRVLAQAKIQLKGQLAVSDERHRAFMSMMAKSLLDYGTIQTLEELNARIDAVTAETMQQLAYKYMNIDKLSRLCYLPS